MQKILMMTASLAGLLLAAGALANPIELRVAHYEGFAYQQPQSIHGELQVANLAYEKQVIVHYRYQTESPWSEWRTVEATHSRALEDGDELWRFQTPGIAPYYRGANFDFYLEYRVRGEQYQEGSAQSPHRIGAGYLDGKNYVWTILGNQTVALDKASIDPRGRFILSAVVKKGQHPGAVSAIYSTDGWKTAHTIDLRYQYEFGAGVEKTFGMDLIFPEQEVEFAIRYRVDGVEHWDNNNGQNHRVTLTLR